MLGELIRPTRWLTRLAPALVVALACGQGSTPASAGGLCRQRVVLVPASTGQVTREVYREVDEPTTRTVVYREVVREVVIDPKDETPSPQAAAKEVEPAPAPAPVPPKVAPKASAQADADPAPVVVRERYIIRERVVAPVVTRQVVVRTVVRVVPVERYVIREVQAAPTYVIVKPKHHLHKGW